MISKPVEIPTPPPQKEETYDPDSRTLHYARNQRPTQAETEFRDGLIRNLRANDVAVDIGYQEKLVIPLKCRASKTGAIGRQLSRLLRRYKNADHCIRCPDFLLLKYGLIIEIDGSVHDSSQRRWNRDKTREAEYALLHLRCHVVYNHQLYDDRTRTQVFKEILAYIRSEESTPGFKQRWQNRRTAVSRARNGFKRANPNTTADIGSFQRNPKMKQTSDGRVAAQWGGQRLRISQPTPHPETGTKRP